jgi:uncharacterized membrane protein YphA (DoxX/SURF4 family)
LQKHYSTFPGGQLGVGLLILRTTAAVPTALFGGILLSRLGTFAANQVSYLCHLVLGLLLVTGGVFLILGLMVPFVSIMVAGSHFIAAYIRLTTTAPFQGALLLLACITIALFFLGPGAYSIDSRLYGRRQIFIPSAKRKKSEES